MFFFLFNFDFILFFLDMSQHVKLSMSIKQRKKNLFEKKKKSFPSLYERPQNRGSPFTRAKKKKRKVMKSRFQHHKLRKNTKQC